MNKSNVVKAVTPAPVVAGKVVRLADAAAFKKLNAASSVLVTSYGAIGGIASDILAGTITGGQVRAWELSFKDNKEASERARSVIRQVQNRIRSMTKGRKASDGGKVTFILNSASDAYGLSKVGHNRSGNTGKTKDKDGEAPALTVNAAAEWMLAYVNDKARTLAELAAAREAVTPIARKLGIIAK